jgi:hypothetical protein
MIADFYSDSVTWDIKSFQNELENFTNTYIHKYINHEKMFEYSST